MSTAPSLKPGAVGGPGITCDHISTTHPTTHPSTKGSASLNSSDKQLPVGWIASRPAWAHMHQKGTPPHPHQRVLNLGSGRTVLLPTEHSTARDIQQVCKQAKLPCRGRLPTHTSPASHRLPFPGPQFLPPLTSTRPPNRGAAPANRVHRRPKGPRDRPGKGSRVS